MAAALVPLPGGRVPGLVKHPGAGLLRSVGPTVGTVMPLLHHFCTVSLEMALGVPVLKACLLQLY